MNFIDEPRYSERRILERGIYTTYSFGDPSSHKTVRIILLDVRFNKSSAFFDTDADVLGHDQWKWLEDIILTSNETFTFIASGTEILPFDRMLTESWYGYSRKRLFDLLGALRKPGVILLSGDVHHGHVLKTFCVHNEIGYNLYELVSSGLSHFDTDYFLMNYLLPDRYSVLPTVNNYNFGKISFSWGNTKNESFFDFSLIDAENVIRNKISIPYYDLVYDKKKIIDPFCDEKLNSRFKSPTEYIMYYLENKIMIFVLVLYLWIVITIVFGICIIYKFLKYFCINVKKVYSNRHKLD